MIIELNQNMKLKNHEKAFEYIEKAVTGYKSAIELDKNM